MKKIRSNMKYLSFRLQLYLILLFAVMTLLVLIPLPHLGPDFPGRWVLLLAAVDLFAVGGWFFLIKPYRYLASQSRKFMEGFIPMTDLLESPMMYSPSSEQTLRRLSQLAVRADAIDLSKRQAQYRALQNQINPHFLYNTLDGIRSEALLAGMDSLADMTEALASFFRYTISRTENLVTIEEELENCRTYFKIQQYRFGSRLRLEIAWDEEDWEVIRKALIPKLTLQPVIENSIIHGTELKIGEGVTRIILERSQTRTVIRVRDNGVGMGEEQLRELNGKLRAGEQEPDSSTHGREGGVALTNVNNRIRLIFGEEYGIHVYSMLGEGTEVEISVPLTAPGAGEQKP